jgi:NAD(P)H dehydrogenase (quinone)
MKILVFLAHPSERSFNYSIAQTTVNALTLLRHEVVFHDLYLEEFNPVIRPEEIASDGEVDENIKRHCADLASADGIVVIHPNWLGQPPAVLKGWVDRVFRKKLLTDSRKATAARACPWAC